MIEQGPREAPSPLPPKHQEAENTGPKQLISGPPSQSSSINSLDNLEGLVKALPRLHKCVTHKESGTASLVSPEPNKAFSFFPCPYLLLVLPVLRSVLPHFGQLSYSRRLSWLACTKLSNPLSLRHQFPFVCNLKCPFILNLPPSPLLSLTRPLLLPRKENCLCPRL